MYSNIHKNKNRIKVKNKNPIIFLFFYKCLTNRAYKKVQYGYHGKNCLVSDHTERTLCEIYSTKYES